MKNYDVIIIGAGPAGCTAAVYCGRAELKTAMFERFAPGGQMSTTTEIENYPGFPQGVDAVQLAMDMSAQAERFGTETIYDDVLSIKDENGLKILTAASGEEYSAKAVILAMGASPRELGVKGEKEFRGRGVSYCATCDGAFFRGKTVMVVGGGDTAAADAVFLSKICEKVYLVHRRDKLRAAKVYDSKLRELSNVEFVWDSTVTSIEGDGKVSSASLKNVKTGEEFTLATDAVFIAVGVKPSTDWLEGLVDMNEAGFILAGETTETSMAGVFAAGDCRVKPLRQVITAASDGAVAAYMAEEHITRS